MTQPLEAALWGRVAEVLPGKALDRMRQTMGLEDLDGLAGEIPVGEVKGRVMRHRTSSRVQNSESVCAAMEA